MRRRILQAVVDVASGVVTASAYFGYLYAAGSLLKVELSETNWYTITSGVLVFLGLLVGFGFPLAGIRSYPRWLLRNGYTFIVLCTPLMPIVWALLSLSGAGAVAFVGGLAAPWLAAAALHHWFPVTSQRPRESHLRGAGFRLTFEEAQTRAAKLREGECV